LGLLLPIIDVNRNRIAVDISARARRDRAVSATVGQAFREVSGRAGGARGQWHWSLDERWDFA
jgi:hypothetical protein